MVGAAEAAQLGRVARRAALSRGCTGDAADDVAPETVARVLNAADRLEASARLPFAVTTARNLAVDTHRSAARDRRNRHRLVDLTEVSQPDAVALAAERSHALGSALDALEPPDRDVLVAHSEGVGTAELAVRHASTPGAIAARLARSRARMRLDYVLALRKVALPTAACRPVLMAVSAGDTRRQRAVDTAGHLGGCLTCTELVPPLVQRRSILAGVAVAPLVMLGGWGGRIARAGRHPTTQAGAAVTAAVAVAVAVVVFATNSPPGSHTGAAVAPSATPGSPQPSTKPGPVSWLRSADGVPVALRDAAEMVGQRVQVRGAPVQAVVSHPGFWIGASPAQRIYVHLTRPQLVIRPAAAGSTVSFDGVLVAHRLGFAAGDGVQAAGGRAQLDSQGIHIEAPATALG